MNRWTRAGAIGASAAVLAVATAEAQYSSAVLQGKPGVAKVDYERQVRPILSARCFGCHGPRQQTAGLRLDSREALLRCGDSGPAIAAKKPEESLLLRAVRRAEGVEGMPPEDSGPPLTQQEIADVVANLVSLRTN